MLIESLYIPFPQLGFAIGQSRLHEPSEVLINHFPKRSFMLCLASQVQCSSLPSLNISVVDESISGVGWSLPCSNCL